MAVLSLQERFGVVHMKQRLLFGLDESSSSASASLSLSGGGASGGSSVPPQQPVWGSGVGRRELAGSLRARVFNFLFPRQSFAELLRLAQVNP